MPSENAGLILEGGGNRGVFTAGVLQYFMERQLNLPYVIGVSAGACNAVNYVSNQPFRSRECMIDAQQKYPYTGLKQFLKQRTVFNMDLLFDDFPNKLVPFDYQTFFQSDKTCYFVATNCLTGQAEYLEERKSKQRLMAICRASSSLPLMAHMVDVDGTPMLDGGMADSIPICRALRDGYKKNVLILTRPKGYRKKTNSRYNRLVRIAYRNYPKLVRTTLRRPLVYNRTLEFIEHHEEKGHLFVIRPQIPVVRSTETQTDLLQKFYDHGYEYARQIYPDLCKYLNISEDLHESGKNKPH